jgi:hypothetical protein
MIITQLGAIQAPLLSQELDNNLAIQAAVMKQTYFEIVLPPDRAYKPVPFYVFVTHGFFSNQFADSNCTRSW